MLQAIGGCNIFGCNCAGGCRKGSTQSVVKDFKRLNPDYKLKGY